MWTIEILNAAVDAEIEVLPVDMRARLVRLGTIIETAGFQGLPGNTVKHLEEKLWECASGAKTVLRAPST